jgi:hypothetical protein
MSGVVARIRRARRPASSSAARTPPGTARMREARIRGFMATMLAAPALRIMELPAGPKRLKM